jgi:hypothetical protein
MDEYIPACYASVTTLNDMFIDLCVCILIEFQTIKSRECYMKFHTDDPLHVKSKII